MFINLWYAAALAPELRDKPLRVRMLGQNFVLFRDRRGVAHCLANVCVHRCGSLAQGWVSGDRVVCPYHGWEFNGDGQCERIPSLGPDQPAPPGRARVDAYPTVERCGLVFVFLGDLPEAERPPIMPVPEWDDSAWRCTTSAFSIKANYRRLVENALDFGHAEYVHFVGRRGADPAHRVPDYVIRETPWGAGAEVAFPRQAKGLWRFFSDASQETRAGSEFHGPAQFVTRIRIDARMWAWQYVFETPGASLAGRRPDRRLLGEGRPDPDELPAMPAALAGVRLAHRPAADGAVAPRHDALAHSQPGTTRVAQLGVRHRTAEGRAMIPSSESVQDAEAHRFRDGTLKLMQAPTADSGKAALVTMEG
jgi:nitrite reductase/ring-hydroxylating ferredoxin subunit